MVCECGQVRWSKVSWCYRFAIAAFSCYSMRRVFIDYFLFSKFLHEAQIASN